MKVIRNLGMLLLAGVARNPSGTAAEIFQRLDAPVYFASFLASRYQSRICSPFQCSTP